MLGPDCAVGACAGFNISRKLNSKQAIPQPLPLVVKKGQKGETVGRDNNLLKHEMME